MSELGADLSTEAIHQLLHPHIHPLRALQPVLEYPLVPGQG